MIPRSPNGYYAPGPGNPYSDLSAWLWVRQMLKHVPREALVSGEDRDDLEETVKLVDVAVRDSIRRIKASILDTGMPNLYLESIDRMPREPNPRRAPTRRVVRTPCPKCFHIYRRASCECCRTCRT